MSASFELLSIEQARYALRPRSGLGRGGQGPREGAILRARWADGARGYADLFPWPELGDPSLFALLGSLSEGPEEGRAGAPLIERALATARLDGVARAEGRWLFEGLALPPCYGLLPGLSPRGEGADRYRPEEALEALVEEGFAEVKVKVGDAEAPREEGEEVGRLLRRAPALGLRLDANGRFDAESLPRFMEGLQEGLQESLCEPLGARLRAFEDPLATHPALWKNEALEASWVACDRPLIEALLALEALEEEERGAELSFSVAVIKPALLDPEEAAKRALAVGVRELILTSYLGHPLEQLAAAYAAARLIEAGLPVGPAGLATDRAYAPSPASRRLRWAPSVGSGEARGGLGPRLIPPEGTGLGLDEELEALSFAPLFARAGGTR